MWGLSCKYYIHLPQKPLFILYRVCARCKILHHTNPKRVQKIVNIDISIDRFTNRNPSYCFVDLASPSAASTAMQTLSGKLLLGRPVMAKLCVQKRAPQPTSRVFQPYSEPLYATRWKAAPLPVRERAPADVATGLASNPAAMWGRKNDSTSLFSPSSPSSSSRIYRIRIDNLPKPLDQHSSDLEIRALFHSREIEVENISKVKSPENVVYKGGNQWFAFVDLAEGEDVERAVRLADGMERWGGVVKARNIRKDTGTERFGRRTEWLLGW
jgi:hypothetical protein